MRFVVGVGGRHDRKDSDDIEPCIFIPRVAFVECAEFFQSRNEHAD